MISETVAMLGVQFLPICCHSGCAMSVMAAANCKKGPKKLMPAEMSKGLEQGAAASQLSGAS
jgi:carbonic anhydrase